MVRLNQRIKNDKKGITPVIATIILIAGTLVLALVVGAYTFGIFGSNVKTITAPSLYLYSGAAATVSVVAPCTGANLAMTVTNPGGATTLTGITVNGPGGAVPESTFFLSAAAACTATVLTGWAVGAGATGLSVIVYFGTTALTSGTTYNYVVTFANGQAISGSLIAQ